MTIFFFVHAMDVTVKRYSKHVVILEPNSTRQDQTMYLSE